MFFSPQSHFFKKHDNKIYDLKKSPTDLLEKQYAELDSQIAPVFIKLKNEEEENCYGITYLNIKEKEAFGLVTTKSN